MTVWVLYVLFVQDGRVQMQADQIFRTQPECVAFQQKLQQARDKVATPLFKPEADLWACKEETIK